MHEATRDRYDVIHAHSAEALALSRFRADVPLAYTIHHARDEHFSDYYPYFPDVQYVAISARQADLEVELARMHVIHHGLDPSKYEWTARPRSPDRVAFIGRFTEYKGPHTAVDAAARAGVRIAVAGEVHDEGREWAERELIPRLEHEHVDFLGAIDMEEKVPLLRDARALLAPITWDEPFGLILIEAMLSGCPVVAFERGSVGELVKNGLTGYVVDDDAAMERVIRPGGPLDTFDRGRCRRRAVERFGAKRMVRDYEALFEEMVRPHDEQRRAA